MADQISLISRREPNLLYRTPGEIRAAIEQGRAVVVGDDRVEGFLSYHVYGRWGEIATAWVAPELRRRGLVFAMHGQLIERMRSRGVRAFEFPGNEAAERALVRIGFVRAPLRTLPLATWLRFVAARLRWNKARSYWKAVRAGTHRTSTRLYVLPAERTPARATRA